MVPIGTRAPGVRCEWAWDVGSCPRANCLVQRLEQPAGARVRRERCGSARSRRARRPRSLAVRCSRRRSPDAGQTRREAQRACAAAGPKGPPGCPARRRSRSPTTRLAGRAESSRAHHWGNEPPARSTSPWQRSGLALHLNPRRSENAAGTGPFGGAWPLVPVRAREAVDVRTVSCRRRLSHRTLNAGPLIG